MDVQTIEQQARALLVQGRLAEAEGVVYPHLASGTGPIPLWRLLAQIVRQQGRISETRTIQQMLVDTIPGDLSGRFDLAETLLLLGEFDRGWREYHYRYSLPHTTRIERKVQKPRWDGRPIPGKTLLIHDEQGFGDTFQFLRMVGWAKERSGARVVLEINRETLSLAKRATGYDELVLRGTLPPFFDVHCEMMSLPMVLDFKLADLPGRIPYLSAHPTRLAIWRKRLAKCSMTLADLAPLGATGATFLAVQKGPRAIDAKTPPPGMSLVALDDDIADFEDTAAILSIADLLISVDSSPVHLAGALGRPAWVMLPFVPDWRWLMERADTPWYPTLRLFRQRTLGDWTDVMRRMTTELIDRSENLG